MNIIKIIEAYHGYLSSQDNRNYAAKFAPDVDKSSFASRTKYHIIPSISKSGLHHIQAQAGKKVLKYELLNKLRSHLNSLPPHSRVHLTDEIMGVNKDEMPSKQQCYKIRKSFLGYTCIRCTTWIF